MSDNNTLTPDDEDETEEDDEDPEGIDEILDGLFAHERDCQCTECQMERDMEAGEEQNDWEDEE